MKCEDIRQELVAYMDGELSPMGEKTIEVHLENCSGCAKKCTELKGAITLTHEVETVEPSPDWWERLYQRIHTHESDVQISAEIRALRESITHMGSRLEQCLSDLVPGKDVMTLEQVAGYLQVETDTVWNLIHEIPHFQIGYELRFRKSSVDEWMHTKESENRCEPFHWDIPMRWSNQIPQFELTNNES